VKRQLKVLILMLIVLFCAINVQAQSLVDTFGAPNSDWVAPMRVDTDRVITVAPDASFIAPYEAATTSDTLAATESGKTISMACSTPNCEIELPTAAPGMGFTFSTNNATILNVDPADTDIIYWSISGVALHTGDKMTSPGATADSVTLFSTAANTWTVTTINGAWVDGGS